MDRDEFKKILNSLQSNIYITDIDTNKIVFMNDQMRNNYHIANPIGKICWEVLQVDQCTQCEFCKISELLKNGGKSIRWQENNKKVGRVFENCDSLIEIEGKTYHMQEALDITEILELGEKVTMDELCGIWNRSSGKQMLKDDVEKLNGSEELAIVLLDVDNIKNVNEQFGRHEGDFLLCEIVRYLKTNITYPDFIFRLSGDEFILVIHGKNEKEASELMIKFRKEIEGLKYLFEKDYDFSFSFGVVSTYMNEKDVNDLIALADEKMFEAKIRRRRTRNLEENDDLNIFRKSTMGFEYDSSLLYDSLIKSTDDFIYVCNMKTGVFRYSPAQVKMFNLPAEVIPNPLPIWKKLVHPNDWNRFYVSNMEISTGKIDYHNVEFRALNKDGEYIWLKCRGQLGRDRFGEAAIFAGIMTPLGKQNKIDPLTQLLNYREFLNDIDSKVKSGMVEQMAILVLDIDDFHQVNEMFDRNYGDSLLKFFAQLVQSLIPDNANLYRLEKDCFGILLDELNEDEIIQLYEKITTELLSEYYEKKLSTEIRVSAGCAIYPKHGDEVEMLSKYADYTLQYAKSNGKGQLAFFSEEILNEKEESLRLIMDIKDSINHGYDGFELNFQPQVNATNQQIVGVEALLRWRDRFGNPVSPLKFIPIIEENGVIYDVGLWVAREAVRACKVWNVYIPDFSVSVNVSILQLLEEAFVDDILKILNEEGFSSKNLILEITESATAKNIAMLQNKLEELRGHGIRIAMDDFGTGYSSLENLKYASLDIVKIDRAFVKNILNSKFDATFISFVVAICHDVLIKVCLEGVELDDEYQLIRGMNLDTIQGYLFGKPQSFDAITKRVKERIGDGYDD